MTERIVRDAVTERGGEPYREIDVEDDYNGGLDELGWPIDDKSPDVIVAARRVLDTKSAAEYGGYLIDLQTANAIVTCYDGLNDTNRAKLLAMADGDVFVLGSLCWKLIGRCKK